MSNHPNRGKVKALDANPSPAALLAFRERHSLTQAQAAKFAMSSLRSWINWESGERRMHPAIWMWTQTVAMQSRE